MKRLLLYVFALAASVALRADDSAVLAAVRAADDARIAAMIAPNGSALEAILSDELHYAHSAEGYVQDKAQHIAGFVSGRSIYQRFDFKQRDFSVVAPGVVLCKGRVVMEVGGVQMIFLVDMNFLAVWRLENQRWRLFAWQSSRNKEIVPLYPPWQIRLNPPPEPAHGTEP